MSQAKFDKAVSIVQGLPKDGPVKPTQDDQLYFYKYFKQATIGNVNTTRPGMLDFVGKAKCEPESYRVTQASASKLWQDAWKGVENTPKEECWEKYVARLIELLKASGDEDSKKHIEEIEAA
ncbi:hypothetical protein EIP86_002776 [Pleurotus ostreatoroseus]|nr:hypothetical protein EIP86_002776 [Pleurotus ostreatoroseus]